jgi:V/A-type H+-transporting ATPase subunit E
MENKLQKLTEQLYEEGLSKGRADAEKLVADAQTKAKAIVAEANAEAEAIVAAAQKQAEDLSKNTMTEISLAGRQAVAKLKSEINGMIVAETASKAVAEATLDAAFVKEMLLAVAKNWNGASTDKVSLSALLPADKQATLDSAFAAATKELLAAGVEIAYSKGVKSGFKIGPKEGGYYISFADEDFDALLGEYLREKVSTLLYKA